MWEKQPHGYWSRHCTVKGGQTNHNTDLILELLVSELESKWKCPIPIPIRDPKLLIPIPGVFQMFDSDSRRFPNVWFRSRFQSKME